jgi:hypothetical protein
MLMRRSNHGVAFPMSDLGAQDNRFGSLINRAPVWDLASPVSTAGIAYSALFLAAQGEAVPQIRPLG